MTNIVALADHRPASEPPGSPSDWRLIAKFADELRLNSDVEATMWARLGGILLEALVGNIEATVAWRVIAAQIKAPLRRRVAGEAVYEPRLDRLQAVVSLAADFWTHHAGGRTCPQYPRQHGEDE
jgi:hypothetical protein